jgi:hypothetical protein
MSMSPTTVSEIVSEYDAIAKTVQQYVDGGKSGRSAEMKAAFHPGATIFGYIGADLFAGPIQKLFDWNDQNGPATELQARLASIDITGNIATARLELDNWTGHRFTDMFTLLKIDGEWRSSARCSTCTRERRDRGDDTKREVHTLTEFAKRYTAAWCSQDAAFQTLRRFKNSPWVVTARAARLD